MRNTANPTLIGAFVLGAIALLIAGLVTFGGGRFFTEKATYVVYFEESIGGLASGAPVTFRGVKVGEVRDIQVHFDSDELTVTTPVYIELQRRRIRAASGLTTDDEMLDKLIVRGLRAQLQLQSIVTGLLGIQLDFHEDNEPRYLNATSEFPEMPTIQSSLAELTETIEGLSLEELVANAQNVVAGLDKLINSPDLAGTLAGLNDGIDELRELVRIASREIDPLARRVEGTLDEADATLASARSTLSEAGHAMAAAADSLSIASDDSPVRYQLQQTIEEVASAARSIRVLADYLERNPDALLRGKGGRE